MGSHPFGWDHPQRPRLLAQLDQDSKAIVDELIRRAAEHDDLDEHEAAAAMCFDLVSDPAQTMIGLAAGVAVLAVHAHRSGSAS